MKKNEIAKDQKKKKIQIFFSWRFFGGCNFCFFFA
jgi:hypothetical protein